MTQLLHLSTELLLQVGSFLSQDDLLNISLTCKHLRHATEPELYREYNNQHLRARSFALFLGRILNRPELATYVRRLELRQWETLSNCFDGEDFSERELSESDYTRFAQAAKTAGVISEVFPYEAESQVIKIFNNRLNLNRSLEESMSPWYSKVFDAQLPIKEVSYDRQFCQLLRSGLEDPFAVLLLAMLPNVNEIHLAWSLDGRLGLKWRAPRHEFRNLRMITVNADGLIWPISNFNDQLSFQGLRNFEVIGGSSWRENDDFMSDIPDAWISAPLSLQPRTVHLRHLVLQSCAMSSQEFQKLMDACCQLKTLVYTCYNLKNFDGGETPLKLSAGELIECLQPHQTTLEELYADIPPRSAENPPGSRIKSLSHFTALRVIDTLPYMWSKLLVEKPPDDDDSDAEDQEPLDEDALEFSEDDFLTRRLPSSVQTLIFRESILEKTEMSLKHLDRLVEEHADRLPNLRRMFIGVFNLNQYALDLGYIQDKIDDAFDDGLSRLELEIGQDNDSLGDARTRFDVTPWVMKYIYR
ncbi:hypothetical protein P280DRAFT_545814 [Massarina eburnea CBS 473.64]|uniref:F-box domain-containing protein n=1 Tax=Massarina eburnea CBS 473.64 TaxID=1395130 RepID=A0A6A6SG74_9PLEO|nr:hypothetical protein P280DRAFT_545814 [Massarina eburnea CBS 473.64]